MVARGRGHGRGPGAQEPPLSRRGVSSGDRKVVAQHGTKCHWVVRFKMVSFVSFASIFKNWKKKTTIAENVSIIFLTAKSVK